MSEAQAVVTERFGRLEYRADQAWEFPRGLIGFSGCRHWLLLGDETAHPVVWLQSLDDAALAIPLVSPRRYVPEYRVHLLPSDIEPLQLADEHPLFVLTTVSTQSGVCTTDLRAPLLFNAGRRLGLQVVAQAELPLQYVLPVRQGWLRRSA